MKKLFKMLVSKFEDAREQYYFRKTLLQFEKDARVLIKMNAKMTTECTDDIFISFGYCKDTNLVKRCEALYEKVQFECVSYDCETHLCTCEYYD